MKQNDYVNLLILNYFCLSEEYDLKTLANTLGRDLNDILNLTSELLNNGLLEYKDYLLSTTLAGKELLKQNHICSKTNLIKKRTHKNDKTDLVYNYLPKSF